MLLTLFGMNWVGEGIYELLFRFAVTLIVVTVLVRYIYFRQAQRKDYLFTYYLIGIIVFFLCFILQKNNIDMGFALGLFAIFGIIRYRTDSIAIKEMTYLFLVIGISVINALAGVDISYLELTFANIVVIITAYGLERIWFQKIEDFKMITYEKIENIKPENETELLRDLENRTGLKIHKHEIQNVNFLRDTASIKIYFYKE